MLLSLLIETAFGCSIPCEFLVGGCPPPPHEAPLVIRGRLVRTIQGPLVAPDPTWMAVPSLRMSEAEHPSNADIYGIIDVQEVLRGEAPSTVTFHVVALIQPYAMPPLETEAVWFLRQDLERSPFDGGPAYRTVAGLNRGEQAVVRKTVSAACGAEAVLPYGARLWSWALSSDELDGLRRDNIAAGGDGRLGLVVGQRVTALDVAKVRADVYLDGWMSDGVAPLEPCEAMSWDRFLRGLGDAISASTGATR